MTSRRQRIACSALTAAALAQALVGVALPLTYEGPVFAWHRTRVAQALYGVAEMPEDALPILRLLIAMLGGTMAAWGVAVAWLAHVPLRRGERWAGWAIAASLFAWFPLDTGLSALHGAWINVAFNVAATMMIAAPLILAWPRR